MSGHAAPLFVYPSCFRRGFVVRLGDDDNVLAEQVCHYLDVAVFPLHPAVADLPARDIERSCEVVGDNLICEFVFHS